MDWHLVAKDDGVAESSDGWTGYTWNKRLFPDPPGFIRWLHDRGTCTALNLHPGGGVHSHEERYEDYANFIGAKALDTRAPIPFDITDRMCASAYFKCLIHPLEEGAGDLAKWTWWCDWQQGGQSRLPGVDPLFLLNHLHYRDLDRRVDGRVVRRPVVFSRYAGHGSHRAPIGFSGDTHSTWDSLAFQPYMTATAANAAFTHWSHDIGGHTRGRKDDALYARWVQFGCLSPILRLHSSNNPFINHQPWSYGKEACEAACDAMRLRHQLVPYVYSCNRKSHTDAEPLVMPMYYTHPLHSDAYAAPAQYWFGSQLVAAPIASPPSQETGLSRQTVWLPPPAGSTLVPLTHPVGYAAWRHLFSGEAMQAGWHAVHGDLKFMPLFAPAGAVVPLATPLTQPLEHDAASDLNSVGNPECIDLYVVAGADGSFSLFEDEESGAQVGFVTELAVRFDSNCLRLTISTPRRVDEHDSGSEIDAATDAYRVLPTKRTWRIVVVGVSASAVAAGDIDTGGGKMSPIPIAACYDAERETATFVISDCDLMNKITLQVSSADNLLSARDRTEENVKMLLNAFNLGVEKKWMLLKRMDTLLRDTSSLSQVEMHEQVPDLGGTLFTITPSMSMSLIETIDKCGFSRNHAARPGAPAIAWSGRRSDVAVMLDGGDRSDAFSPSSLMAANSRLVIWPESDGTVPEKDGKWSSTPIAKSVHCRFGADVSVDIEMRDANDADGPPEPILWSAA
jgi:hypothetical protein